MAVSIDLRTVTKRFSGDVLAVSGFNLTIAPGEMLCILGPSGCGKTTTLRMIAGFEAPDEGEIWFGDRRVDQVPVWKRNVAMVFQDYALFPHKNVYENVAFGLRQRRVSASDIARRVTSALELVSIAGMSDRLPKQLSGGQRQRVALARAIVTDPDILLLDEPLSALDRKLRDQMRTEIKRLQRTVGVTTLFVTHDQEEALTLADRVVVMDQGTIVQVGTPRELYNTPLSDHIATFLGTANLLHGELRPDGSHWVFSGGEDVPPLRLVAPAGRKPGAGTVFIRPEAVGLQPWGEADNRITGRLDEVVFAGHKIRFTATVGGRRLTGEVANTATCPLIREGDPVTLHINPADVKCVPIQQTNQEAET